MFGQDQNSCEWCKGWDLGSQPDKSWTAQCGQYLGRYSVRCSSEWGRQSEAFTLPGSLTGKSVQKCYCQLTGIWAVTKQLYSTSWNDCVSQRGRQWLWWRESWYQTVQLAAAANNTHSSLPASLRLSLSLPGCVAGRARPGRGAAEAPGGTVCTTGVTVCITGGTPHHPKLPQLNITVPGLDTREHTGQVFCLLLISS